MVTKVEKVEDVEDVSTSKVFMMHSGRKAEEAQRPEAEEKSAAEEPRQPITMEDKRLTWKEIGTFALSVFGLCVFASIVFKKK